MEWDLSRDKFLLVRVEPNTCPQAALVGMVAIKEFTHTTTVEAEQGVTSRPKLFTNMRTSLIPR